MQQLQLLPLLQQVQSLPLLQQLQLLPLLQQVQPLPLLLLVEHTTATEAIGEDENLLQDLNLNCQTPVGSERQLSNPYLDIQDSFNIQYDQVLYYNKVWIQKSTKMFSKIQKFGFLLSSAIEQIMIYVRKIIGELKTIVDDFAKHISNNQLIKMARHTKKRAE